MKKQSLILLLAFTLSITNAFAENPGKNHKDLKPGKSMAKKKCKGGNCKKKKSKMSCSKCGKKGHSMMKIFDDLTGEQKKAVFDIKLKYKKLSLEIKEKMLPKKIKLQRLLLDEKPDLEEIKKLLEEIAQFKAQKKFLKVKKKLEIYELLTPKQKDSFKMKMMGKFDS